MTIEKIKQRTKLGNSGFSLVELIIVIAIMAILIAVLAPMFVRYVERSRISTDVQAAGQMSNALKTLAADQVLAQGNGGAPPAELEITWDDDGSYEVTDGTNALADYQAAAEAILGVDAAGDPVANMSSQAARAGAPTVINLNTATGTVTVTVGGNLASASTSTDLYYDYAFQLTGLR